MKYIIFYMYYIYLIMYILYVLYISYRACVCVYVSDVYWHIVMVCMVQHSPSQRILHCLSSIGFTSKSAVLRRWVSVLHYSVCLVDIMILPWMTCWPSLLCFRCCAEIFLQCVTIFDISMMNRILSLIEDLIQIAIKDPDAMARKHGRQYAHSC